MTDEKILKRGWVKKAALIFFAFMLILTFFSNTILNYSLPQVSVKRVESGKIVTAIRGSGTAEAVSRYEIMLEQTRKIKNVMVQPGDSVKARDVLFQLEDEESDELKAALDTLDDLKLQYQKFLIQSVPEDYTKENREIDRAKKALEEAAETKEDNRVSRREVQSAESSLEHRKEEIADLTAEIADLERERSDYAGASDDSLLSLKRQIEDKQYEIEHASEDADLQRLQLELQRLESDYQTMQKNNESYNRISEKIRDAQEDLDDENKSIERTQQRYERLSEKRQNWESSDDEVSQYENTLEDLIYSLQEAKDADQREAQIAQLNLQKLKKDLAEQTQEVQKLQADAVNGTVKSDRDGILQTINVSAGATAAPNTALAVLESAQQGYSLSFSVTKEQSKKIAIGDTAIVTENPDVTATLKQLKNDPDDPEKKSAVFLLEGTIESGDLFSLKLEQPSTEYECIVPNSALHSDSGSFVLTAVSTSTPFGNRYTATRVDVEVLAQDDQNAAVSGALMQYDYVITTATDLLESGMKIRMANS